MIHTIRMNLAENYGQNRIPYALVISISKPQDPKEPKETDPLVEGYPVVKTLDFNQYANMQRGLVDMQNFVPSGWKCPTLQHDNVTWGGQAIPVTGFPAPAQGVSEPIPPASNLDIKIPIVREGDTIKAYPESEEDLVIWALSGKEEIHDDHVMVDRLTAKEPIHSFFLSAVLTIAKNKPFFVEIQYEDGEIVAEDVLEIKQTPQQKAKK
jgi:hypothetical protein